jgi:hypothetical protein
VGRWEVDGRREGAHAMGERGWRAFKLLVPPSLWTVDTLMKIDFTSGDVEIKVWARGE